MERAPLLFNIVSLKTRKQKYHDTTIRVFYPMYFDVLSCARIRNPQKEIVSLKTRPTETKINHNKIKSTCKSNHGLD